MACREERRLKAKVKRLKIAMLGGLVFTDAIKQSGLNCSIHKAHTLLLAYVPENQLDELLGLIKWD